MVRFPSEPLLTCATSPTGPGCTGFPGAAACEGCPPGGTLTYDHCKAPALPAGPGWVDVGMLTDAARAAAAAGHIAPLSHLARSRVLGYRGTQDTVYLDGSVNKTMDAFAALGAATVLYARVPSHHALPTVDPAIPTSSCSDPSTGPPAMANCGFDGAGEALAFFYGAAALTPPASHACGAACAARLLAFNQSRYVPPDWRGGDLSSVAYVHVPAACAAGGCGLHVSLHGCGMSVHSPKMGLSYVTHSGFNAWGESSGFVTLYPQGGGFLERNDAQGAPSPQIGAGCFDGYGQTRADFAWRTGPQLATIAAMVQALMQAPPAL